MNIQKKVLFTRLAYVCFLTLLVAGAIGAVAAFSSGRVGRSGNPNSGGGITCAQCHGGGEIPGVFIEGPTTVAPGETVTYTLRIIGGQEVAGGFNVSASTGELDALPGAADVQAVPWFWDDNTEHVELTHKQPKAVDGDGVVSFSFNWTAPDEAGMAFLYGAGNSVDENGSPIGDGADGYRAIINAASTVYLPIGIHD